MDMTAKARPRVGLRVLGEEIVAEAEVRAERGRLDELLPLLLQLDDKAIEVAVRKNPNGKSVSCAKGCSACCRAQPVPVTPPEAYALWKLVEGLPAERRQQIRDRFANRARRLESAGLKDVFLREEAMQDKNAARRAVEAYIGLGLVCPFLEDDACSIHPARPFVCRQYLVTSDPELCKDPLRTSVEVVPIPIRPAHAMLEVTTRRLGLPGATVPLVLALVYAEKHRPRLEQEAPMKEVIGEWLGYLATS
jgi:Fe-S-cluster containining protein